MQWINYGIAALFIIFLVFFVGRELLRSRRLRKWDNKSQAEWRSIQEMVKSDDPVVQAEASKAFMEKLQKGTPKWDG